MTLGSSKRWARPFNQRSRHIWYLCGGSILSYVVRELTGKAPLAFANEELFPASWHIQGIDGASACGVDRVEEGGHGLILYLMNLQN